MAIKLIAFDLDGTLLTSRKEITPETRAALRAAADKGILTVPASGRLYPGLPEKLKGPDFRYSILCNGMIVYDALEDRKLCEYPLSFEETMRFLDYAESIGIFYDCYADDLAWMSKDIYDDLPRLITDPNFLKMLKELRTPVYDLRSWLVERHKPVQKLLFYFMDPQQRLEQLKIMPELFTDYNITSSIYCNIEINTKASDKGTALRSLCEKLGIDIRDTMVFGDGLNDIGMFRTAGLSVAMANADPALKAEADFVTAGNDENGVAAAIRRFAL